MKSLNWVLDWIAHIWQLIICIGWTCVQNNEPVLFLCLLTNYFVCLFLFVCSLLSHSRNFPSWRITIAAEGLQILTFARHSWPLSSEGSLACHTHCDKGLTFIMVIFEAPWHSHLLPSVWQWSCHYLFLRLRSVATGDRNPISRMPGERSTSSPPRRSTWFCNKSRVI